MGHCEEGIETTTVTEAVVCKSCERKQRKKQKKQEDKAKDKKQQRWFQ